MKRFRLLKHSVLDVQTGLERQSHATGPMAWNEAIEYASGLRLDGRGDWRLPSIEELISLVDFSKNDPASSFPGMPSNCFWSSSSYSGSSSLAWAVAFSYGSVDSYGKTDSRYVRCIRRGPQEKKRCVESG